MGKRSGSSSPAVPQQPSPAELAEAQAKANRITQFTPGGTLEFGTSTPEGGFTPEGGRALRLTETPAQKAIRQLQEIGGIQLGAVGTQLAGQLPTTQLTAEGLTARPDFDLSGVRAIPGEQDQAALEQQYTTRALELLQPELERTEQRQIQDLANIGQPEGSEFFEDVQRRYGNQRASLLSAIAQDAIGRGEARQADVFGRELTRRQAERGDVLDRIGFDQQRRQAELAERVGLRQQAQQELTGLLTGQMLQTPQLANFVPPGQIDVLGPYAMQQNAALQRAQIASADRAATLGALGSLGGEALGGWAQAGFPCDYRLKENIEAMPDGAIAKILQLKPKSYNYREESGLDTSPTEGFIAHEVQEVIPDAVTGNKDGVLPQMINMMSILSTLTKAVQEISARLVKLENN